MNYTQAHYGLLGLLVGDALGVPYEFTPPDKIPLDIEYEPPSGFRKAYNVPPGTWSDDGAQALCVLDAIFRNGNFVKDVAENLLDWRDNGYMAVDGRVFDIGLTTSQALFRYSAGAPPLKSGMVGEKSKSNGSLMRTLPVAFLDPADKDSVVRAAITQSNVTHAEPEVSIACAAYVLWAQNIAADDEDPWNNAFEQLAGIVPKGILTALITHVQHWRGPPTGTGYVTDALHSARYALANGTDYESTVKLAIRFGNDTDTTAAIAGGLAGIKYQAIPERWIQGLRGREILDPVLTRLREWSTLTR